MRYLSHEDTNEDEMCYLCRKIVRNMDRQYQSIEELQNEIIYLHRRIDTLKRGIVSFAIGILLGLIGQYLL